MCIVDHLLTLHALLLTALTRTSSFSLMVKLLIFLPFISTGIRNSLSVERVIYIYIIHVVVVRRLWPYVGRRSVVCRYGYVSSSPFSFRTSISSGSPALCTWHIQVSTDVRIYLQKFRRSTIYITTAPMNGTDQFFFIEEIHYIFCRVVQFVENEEIFTAEPDSNGWWNDITLERIHMRFTLTNHDLWRKKNWREEKNDLFDLFN